MLAAERLLAAHSGFRAPLVLRQEVYNAVFTVERRGLIPPAVAERAIREFEDLSIEYSDHPSWVPRAREIALRFRQPSIFDAIYLVCAEDLGSELWTCDRRFVASFGALRPANLRLCPDDV